MKVSDPFGLLAFAVADVRVGFGLESRSIIACPSGRLTAHYIFRPHDLHGVRVGSTSISLLLLASEVLGLQYKVLTTTDCRWRGLGGAVVLKGHQQCAVQMFIDRSRDDTVFTSAELLDSNPDCCGGDPGYKPAIPSALLATVPCGSGGPLACWRTALPGRSSIHEARRKNSNWNTSSFRPITLSSHGSKIAETEGCRVDRETGRQIPWPGVGECPILATKS